MFHTFCCNLSGETKIVRYIEDFDSLYRGSLKFVNQGSTVATILVTNLEHLFDFPLRFSNVDLGIAVISVLQKYARLNIGEAEEHI